MTAKASAADDLFTVDYVGPERAEAPARWSQLSAATAVPVYDHLVAKEGESSGTNVYTLLHSIKWREDGTMRESWLARNTPLLIDKHRNNIRSRPLLAMIYGVAAAVVAMLVVLSFSFEKDHQITMRYKVAPPKSLAIGSVVPQVSVQVLNEDYEGISDLICGAVLIPVQPILINVQLSTGTVLSRSVSCYDSLMVPNSTTMTDDSLFCMPQSEGILTGADANALTDSTGTFTMTNFSLGFGSPGMYMLLFGCAGLEQSVSSFIEITANVISFDVVACPRQEALEIGVNVSEKNNVSATAMWVSSDPPYRVCATLMALNLHKPNPNPAIISPPQDLVTETAVGFLQPSSVCTMDIQLISNGGGSGAYAANFSIPFGLYASMTNDMFIGVGFMGQVRPLSSKALNSPYQSPVEAVLPYKVKTNVTRVVVTGLPATVVEAMAMSVNVSVEASGPTQVGARQVYIYAQPSFRNGAKDGMSAQCSPYIMPKSLLYGVQLFPDNQTVVPFTNLRFSCSGTAGYYDVFVSCDGVFAQFPNSVDGSLQEYFTIDVKSSVSTNASFVNFFGGTGTEPEYLGQNWVVMPAVGVYSTAGNPLPGKTVYLRPANSLEASVNTVAVTSNEDGVGTFAVAIVTYAAGGPRMVDFHVLVDEMIVANFSRMILFGTFNTSTGYTINATATAGQCAVVRILSLPNETFSDVTSYVLLQAVDFYGSPTPYAEVFVIIDSQYVPPPTGKNSTLWSSATDDNGTVKYPVRTFGGTGSTGLIATAVCMYFPNVFSLYLRNRVKRLSVVPISNVSWSVSIIPYHWSTISAEKPVCLFRSVAWSPGYFANWYAQGGSDYNVTNVVCITNESDGGQIIVTIGPFTAFPVGSFALNFVVNANFFGPISFVTFAPPPPKLVLMQSLFSGDFGIGTLLTQTPIVQASDSNTGAPIEGLRLFAQPVTPLPNGTRVPVDMFIDQAEIYRGSLILFSRTNRSISVSAAFSNASDASGIVLWTDMMCLGALVGYNFSARYCAATDVVLNMSEPLIMTDYCVDDNAGVLITTNSSISINASVETIAGTPGQLLPTILLQGTFAATGQPVPVMFCAPYLANGASRSLLLFQTQTGVPYGSFFGVGSTISLSNNIRLSSSMPEGTYALYFVCVGAVSPVITITVSSQVTSLYPIQIPPNSFYFTQVVSVAFSVLGDSGKPVTGSPVLVSLVSTDKACGLGLKSPCQCGVFLPQSIIFSKSTSTGQAGLLFALACAEEGTYELSVTIPPEGSGNEVQSIAQTGLRSVMGLLGQNYETLVETIEATRPGVATLLGPFRLLSQSPVESSVETQAREQLVALLGFAMPTPVSATFTVQVLNPVHTLQWKNNQPWSYSATLNELYAVSATNAQQTFIISGGDCPTVVLFDKSGNPAPNHSVFVELFPSDGQATLTYSAIGLNNGVSSATGEITVCPITFTTSTPGQFHALFTARGGGNVSAVIEIRAPVQMTRTRLMEYEAGALVLFMSPLLMASVPYAHLRYQIIGIAILLVSVISSAVTMNEVPSGKYYRGYYLFLLVGIGCAAVVSIGVAIADALAYDVRTQSRRGGWYSMRLFNDEKRAEQIVRYTMWLTNIRAEKQQAEERARRMVQKKKMQQQQSAEELLLLEPSKQSGFEEANAPVDAGALSIQEEHQEHPTGGKPTSTARPMKKSASRESDHEVPPPITSNKSSAEDLVSGVKDKLTSVTQNIALLKKNKTKKKRNRILHTCRPTLIYNRPDLEAVSIPFGFYIVVIFTIVILISVAFAVLYILQQITYAFNKVLVYLPNTTQDAAIEAANTEIVNILCAGIALAVQKFPQLGSLMNLIPRLRSVNVVMYLSDVRENMSKILLGIELLFIAAGAISVMAVLTSLFFTHRKIPQLILSIRRGTLKLPESVMKLTAVEGHVGQHVMLLIILQALTFVMVVVVGVICVLPVVQDFVKNNWLVLGVTFGTSALSQKLVEYFVVERLLTDRSFVVRHELYAIWHFAALVLGIFTGVVSGITRWASAVGLLTFAFGSVEMSIMPSAFSTLDKAHNGFLCTVMAEAVNGNPIMLVFCSILVTTNELRRQAVEQSRSLEPEADAESLLLDQRRTSATVINIARLIGRRLASTANSLELQRQPETSKIPLGEYIEDVAWRRRCKVRQRFWLWWILLKNPSLRQDRKHQLAYDDDDDDDDGDLLEREIRTGQSSAAV